MKLGTHLTGAEKVRKLISEPCSWRCGGGFCLGVRVPVKRSATWCCAAGEQLVTGVGGEETRYSSPDSYVAKKVRKLISEPCSLAALACGDVSGSLALVRACVSSAVRRGVALRESSLYRALAVRKHVTRQRTHTWRRKFGS